VISARRPQIPLVHIGSNATRIARTSPGAIEPTDRRAGAHSPEMPGLVRCLALCSGVVAWGLTAQAQPRDTFPDTWEATDGLGRTLPTHADVGDPNGRLVLIFYYMWHQRNGEPQPYDISKIIAGKTQPWSDAPWGPSPAFHWWSEPALGYYDINDEFVIRRHAQMLADAGVDAIVLDVTNAVTYDSTWTKLCSTYQALRDAGNRTPNIAFIAHASSDATVQHLYDQLYAKNECAGLWQQWLGKPLVLAAPGGGLSAAATNFFTFRESWAWTDPSGWFGDGHDKWPWLDNFPQNYGWHDSASIPEEIPIGVAQHPTGNYGRSHHSGQQEALDAHYETPDTPNGLGFQEQWDTALAKKPNIAFVTQWNEWIAQRFVTCGTYDSGATQFLGKPLTCGDTHFIDEFNPEFSRDAEPMKGGFGDAYYYQLAANVRRFKGARVVAEATAPKTIPTAGFSAFSDVGPDYLDDVGDVTHRSALGFSGPDVYLTSSGRNDLVLARVARDANNLYFYVKTQGALSPQTDAAWLELWLDSDADATTGYLGFDYLVNRTRAASGASIEHFDGKAWNSVGSAAIAVSTDEVLLTLPRTNVNLPASAFGLTFRFKWSDNLPDPPQAADFIDQGDVAPNGRFAYRYHAAIDIEPGTGGVGGVGGMGGTADPSAGGAAESMNGGAGAGGASDGATGNQSALSGASADATVPTNGNDRGCSCSVSSHTSDVRWAFALSALMSMWLWRRRRARCGTLLAIYAARPRSVR
jgi:MYXO-CTERM domain-containing protein